MGKGRSTLKLWFIAYSAVLAAVLTAMALYELAWLAIALLLSFTAGGQWSTSTL
jgi:hypothetical protein